MKAGGHHVAGLVTLTVAALAVRYALAILVAAMAAMAARRAVAAVRAHLERPKPIPLVYEVAVEDRLSAWLEV